MNAVIRYIKGLFRAVPPIAKDEIEAYCPKCWLHQRHKIRGDIYSCTVCGNKQKSDEALTRQDTSW